MILEGVIGESYLGDILIRDIAIKEGSCQLTPAMGEPSVTGEY